MAHFAEIDASNTVLRVLVIDNAHESNGVEYLADTLGLGGTWIQTSYNAKIRGKYAGVGDTYDAKLDRFISAQPYPSWLLQKDFNWQAPKPMPQDDKMYDWDEAQLDWVERVNLS